jgi:hypothetical protein
MSANTLAAAFAAATTRPSQPATQVVAALATPMQRPVPMRTPITDETILMTILRQSLSPSDQIMARKAMLGPAPWELQ